jgi:hypothetical protein
MQLGFVLSPSLFPGAGVFFLMHRRGLVVGVMRNRDLAGSATRVSQFSAVESILLQTVMDQLTGVSSSFFPA